MGRKRTREYDHTAARRVAGRRTFDRTRPISTLGPLPSAAAMVASRGSPRAHTVTDLCTSRSRGHGQRLLPPEGPGLARGSRRASLGAHGPSLRRLRARWGLRTSGRAAGPCASACVVQGAAVACVHARETRAGDKSARALRPCLVCASQPRPPLSFATSSRDRHPLSSSLRTSQASLLTPPGQVHSRAAQ